MIELDRYTFVLPGPKDVFQILIVAIAFYYVLRLLARTRAIQMLIGLTLLVVVFFISRLLDLMLINRLLGTLFQYGAFAALIVFQPELRAGLSRLGQSRMIRLFNNMADTEVAEELMEGIERLSRAKVGAIVAMQRDVGLDEYAETGSRIHARVSADLLMSIFGPYGPLHDGAVLISGDTIIAAGVILPLTQFPITDKSLGTRHRAAIGLSEETDSLIIVVSEETSQISIAQRGQLERDVDMRRLREALVGAAAAIVPAGD